MSEDRRPTRDECLDAAADVLIASDRACASMTAREQAEAAWHPGARFTVDELEDRIRAERGLAPLRRAGEGA